MIRRLRGEFIRIAMLAVTLVLLLLTVSVNAVNYISVSRQQDRTLEMIVSHQGTIPAMPKEAKSGPRPNGHFSPETPYDTRFFVLRYTDSGDLTQSDLTHIASVTEADAEPYLQAALSHGVEIGAFSKEFPVDAGVEYLSLAIYGIGEVMRRRNHLDLTKAMPFIMRGVFGS